MSIMCAQRKTITGYILVLGILGATVCFAISERAGQSAAPAYERWASVGRMAADAALAKMKANGLAPQKGYLVAMTNAAFAEVNGLSTAGALDGLALGTGTSRGNNTMVEIHSAHWNSLWFAVYDPSSGACVYLQVEPGALKKATDPTRLEPDQLFGIFELESIGAQYIFDHAAEFKHKLDNKMFGGNAFRIVTIANAISAGAPTAVLRAFEFHDHYCPGVTAGIFMVNYLKKNFPLDHAQSYFVQTIDPWCKDDALMVLLNATPGKRSYAAAYPDRTESVGRTTPGSPASTIIYRQDKYTKRWQGIALAFEWAETGCQRFEDGLIQRLCDDLWYLDRLNQPEDFVTVLKSFELPEGQDPRSLAVASDNAVRQLGLDR